MIRFIIFLFLFIPVTVCSHAQPFAEIRLRKHQFNNDVIATVDSIYRFWNNRKDIQANPGSSYQYILGDDTLRFLKPPAGKKIRAKITFEEVGGTTPLPDIITNIDNVPTVTANTYQPAWIQFTNPAFFSSTASYSPTTGAKLTTKFTGYKIEWFSEKAKNHGIAGVKIDGVAWPGVDLYANTTVNNSQKVFEWTGTNGAHEIEITVTGTANQLATETNIIHDYFRVYAKQ